MYLYRNSYFTVNDNFMLYTSVNRFSDQNCSNQNKSLTFEGQANP